MSVQLGLNSSWCHSLVDKSYLPKDSDHCLSLTNRQCRGSTVPIRYRYKFRKSLSGEWILHRHSYGILSCKLICVIQKQCTVLYEACQSVIATKVCTAAIKIAKIKWKFLCKILGRKSISAICQKGHSRCVWIVTLPVRGPDGKLVVAFRWVCSCCASNYCTSLVSILSQVRVHQRHRGPVVSRKQWDIILQL